jgi:hypothetical protein
MVLAEDGLEQAEAARDPHPPVVVELRLLGGGGAERLELAAQRLGDAAGAEHDRGGPGGGLERLQRPHRVRVGRVQVGHDDIRSPRSAGQHCQRLGQGRHDPDLVAGR